MAMLTAGTPPENVTARVKDEHAPNPGASESAGMLAPATLYGLYGCEDAGVAGLVSGMAAGGGRIQERPRFVGPDRHPYLYE